MSKTRLAVRRSALHRASLGADQHEIRYNTSTRLESHEHRTFGDASLKRVISGLLSFVAVGMLAVVVPTTVVADDWDDEEELFYIEGGSYFAGGISYLAEDFANKIGDSSTDKGFHRVDGHVKTAEGFNLIFGRRAFEYVGLELQFEFSDGFQFNDEDGKRFDLKVYSTTFNIKTYPLYSLLKSVNEGRIQPHLISGAGIMVTRDLDIDTGASAAVRVGGGLDYYFSERWAINLQSTYMLPFGQLKGLRYITTSFGLSYRLE